MSVAWRVIALGCLLAASGVACNDSRGRIDSAAGAAGTSASRTLSLVAVDMGRHLDARRKVSDATDDFSPSDTIFASVHTTGNVANAPVAARWTFQDGSTISEMADTVTTNGDAYSAFFIVRPGGLPKGTYTLHVFVNGKEVRSKDATVK